MSLSGSNVAGALLFLLSVLAGSITQWWLFRRIERRRERQQREDRVAAYDAFANGLSYYRRAECDYVRRRLEAPGSPTTLESHAQSFRVRSTAAYDLLRVQLAARDPQIVELAERAFAITEQVHDAETAEQADRDANRAEQALAQFVTATGATVYS
ncbi:hypothetical protein [Actinomadura sp. 9N407]|uniref:hypothetical protein n=1 Tax=Actinomadura sp. 9N407 TaxID=3375154 RepID=UPI0037B6B19E